jgi:hypothetical protein
MATFAVIAEHPPDLCPTSNAQTRQILKEGASQIPQLAEQLGVDIGTLRIFGPDHIILVVVEADDIDSVRNFAPPEPPHAVEHGKDPRHLLDRGGCHDGRRGGGHLLGLGFEGRVRVACSASTSSADLAGGARAPAAQHGGEAAPLHAPYHLPRSRRALLRRKRFCVTRPPWKRALPQGVVRSRKR